jgi:hypothetical protein
LGTIDLVGAERNIKRLGSLPRPAAAIREEQVKPQPLALQRQHSTALKLLDRIPEGWTQFAFWKGSVNRTEDSR